MKQREKTFSNRKLNDDSFTPIVKTKRGSKIEVDKRFLTNKEVLTIEDRFDEDTILYWHGVRVTNKKDAELILRGEAGDITDLKIMDNYKDWAMQIQKYKTWWQRIKTWLFQYFPFLRQMVQ